MIPLSYDKIIGTTPIIYATELVSLLFSLFWKNLEAHCFHYDKVQRTTSRLDDFTTDDLTIFTTSRLVIDLETGFTVQK
jgi:hypothetical protein